MGLPELRQFQGASAGGQTHFRQNQQNPGCLQLLAEQARIKVKQRRRIGNDSHEVRIRRVEQIEMFVRYERRPAPVSSTARRRAWRLRHPTGRIGPGRHDIRYAPSGRDVMFDAGQGSLDQSDSFVTGKQFGRSAIPKDFQGR